MNYKSYLEYLEEITQLSLKILLIYKLHTFVNERNFDIMSFMDDLRINIRTKEMLNITPCQKCCFI